MDLEMQMKLAPITCKMGNLDKYVIQNKDSEYDLVYVAKEQKWYKQKKETNKNK